jgi:tetratricopeptide (TPR) repeat protein
MLIPILKQLPQNSKIHEEILNKYPEYYQTNDYEFFRKNYTSHQAIEWYIKKCFPSKLFNQALCMKNIEILYSFSLFILDLYLSIDREYEHIQNQGNLIVYHAQWMSKEEINQLKNNLGSFICINEFFITSRNRNISLEIFKQNFPFYEHILFEIHVDLSIKTIRLVDIPSLNEILFSINSLFRIESIEYDLIDQLWNVKIFASDDDLIQKEIDHDSSMIYFGHLLWNEFKQIEQAEYFFQILLKSFSNDHQNLPSIYMELGDINNQIRKYNLALNYYQYALDIRQKQIPKDDIQIALVLNNIGVVYKHMGDIDRAIEFYQQSLETGSSKDVHRADTLANLGSVYRDRNDLDTALNYYQQALSIKEEIPDRNKANITRNIGLIYQDKQDWTNALKYFNQTLEIHQIFQFDLAICYGDLGYIYEKMNNFDLALINYQQQYQIEEKYLSIDHPNLILHFDSIINIFKKKDQIDRAIEFCQEKLSQYENHPHITRILILLATMYEDKNPKTADQYYQQALNILEQYKTDEIFAKSLSTMTNFYWKCRMFDRALICQMKLLHFRRSTLLSNHTEIAYTLHGLARLYRAMNKTTEALQYFEQSLAILQANYGSEHIDVKNIQKEIFDLKDILNSISLSPNEDYNNRRISSTQKQLSKDDSKSSSSSVVNNRNMNNKLSKSIICCIL